MASPDRNHEPSSQDGTPSLAERVHGQLLDDISQGDWTGDEIVSAYSLARRLGVSRTPVVEALKRLEAEGLIEILPKVGARLRRTPREATEELYAILASVLGLAAERAARRVDDAWLDRLDRLVDELAEATADSDLSRYRRASAQLCIDLIRLGLTAHAPVIEPVWRLMRTEALRDRDAVIAPEGAGEFRAIIDALRIRSPGRARAAAERHIAGVAARAWNERQLGGHEGELEHAALLYHSPSEFLAKALPFVLEGLRQDEPVLVVVAPRNVDVLTSALGTDASRIHFRDSRDWYEDPAAALRGYRDHIERHRSSSPVRIVGEPTWKGRDALETADWLRYESVINVALESSAARILCPYDAGRLPTHILNGARSSHPHICEFGTTEVSADYRAFFTTTRS